MNNDKSPANGVLKVLSFLGTGNYQNTEYVLAGREPVQTSLIQDALATWYPTADFMLFATEEAAAKNQSLISSHLGGRVTLCEVPAGSSESQMWEIFDVISRVVDDEDQLVVDVTHGFRSQPILLLAACNFLEQLKSVRIVDVLYGAFVPSSPQTEVVSLKPFLELTSWMVAVNSAVHYGSFGRVTDLVKAAESPNKEIRALSRDLGRFCDALETNRVEETFRMATKLTAEIDRAIPEFARTTPNASNGVPSPADEVLRRFHQVPASLSFKTDELGTYEGRVRAFRALLNQLLVQRGWQQAVTVAREAMVTCGMIHLGLPFEDPDQRIDFGRRFDGVLSDKSRRSEAKTSVAGAWDSVRELRNDVNHCGYRRAPMEADRGRTEKRVRDACERLISVLEDGTFVKFLEENRLDSMG